MDKIKLKVLARFNKKPMKLQAARRSKLRSCKNRSNATMERLLSSPKTEQKSNVVDSR